MHPCVLASTCTCSLFSSVFHVHMKPDVHFSQTLSLVHAMAVHKLINVKSLFRPPRGYQHPLHSGYAGRNVVMQSATPIAKSTKLLRRHAVQCVSGVQYVSAIHLLYSAIPHVKSCPPHLAHHELEVFIMAKCLFTIRHM